MPAGRPYAGELPADRVARRRRQLLDAGLHLFGSHGYRRVTVRQLCAEAHVSHRGFYDEFASAEDLLVAVYDECMDRLERAVRHALRDPQARLTDAIATALDAFFEVVEDDAALGRVVWFEVLGISERVDELYLRRIEAFVTLLDGMLDALRLTGPLTGARRQVVMRALVGGVSEVVRRWLKDGYATPRGELVEPLTMLFQSVAAGLVDPAES